MHFWSFTPLIKSILSFYGYQILSDVPDQKNRWIFGKVPNGLRPTFLIFEKLNCNFFIKWILLHICKEVWGPDSIGIQKCLLQSVSGFDSEIPFWNTLFPLGIATTKFSIWLDKLQMQLYDITIWNKKRWSGMIFWKHKG